MRFKMIFPNVFWALLSFESRRRTASPGVDVLLGAQGTDGVLCVANALAALGAEEVLGAQPKLKRGQIEMKSDEKRWKCMKRCMERVDLNRFESIWIDFTLTLRWKEWKGRENLACSSAPHISPRGRPPWAPGSLGCRRRPGSGSEDL